MKLKSTILAVAALVVALFSTTNEASAQDLAGWTGGAKVNFYTGWDTSSLGVYGRYTLNNGLRLEPSVSFIFAKGCTIDVTVDAHYIFDLGDKFEAYPLVGVSINDPGKFGFAANFGGGLGYKLSDVINLDLGMKWALQTQSYISNPFIISIGGGYKF
ncbi:MAG: hypothetical protein R3Y16_03340 [Rikenellaceae bacterium]